MYLNRCASFLFGLILLVGLQVSASAQVGDDFNDAIEIPIPDQGFGTATLISQAISLANKTTELNEYFPKDLVLAALVEKSVWYKFTLPTNRNVTVQLEGLGTMPPQDAGFAIYKNPGAFAGPHRLTKLLPPLNKMGSVQNSCLEAGVYYIQVLARKRSTDSVQIKLDVRKNGNVWSETQNAYLVQNFGNSVYTSSGECSYIPDVTVAAMMPDSSYHHFFNWRFEAYAKFSKTRHDFLISGLKPSFYYIVKEAFPDPINQWQILDSGQVTDASNTVIWDCVQGNSLAEGTYRILLFSQAPGINKVLVTHRLQNQGSSFESHPQKLPANQQLGSIASRATIEGTLSCNTPVYTQVCPNLNNDLFSINSLGDSIPLEFQTWFTFEVPNDCRMAINSQRIGTQPDISSKLEIRMYQGSNLTNCTLTRILPDYGRVYCLKGGQSYTIRILCPYDQGILDNPFRLFLDQITYVNHPHQYSDSLYPEMISDPLKSFPSAFTGEPAFLEYRAKQVYMGEDTLFVGAIFREFYVSEDLIPFKLSIKGYTIYAQAGSGLYLQRGRKSLGTADEVISKFGGSVDFPAGLAKGWYTCTQIVGPLNGDCHDMGADKAYQLEFSALEECNTGSVEGSLAKPIQVNPSPLVFTSQLINGINYDAPNTYTTSNLCFTTRQIDTGYAAWLNQSCPTANYPKGFNYVEFDILDEAEAYISVSGYRYYLLRGAVSVNPSLRFNTSNYIHPCNWEGKFCRLVAGNYTVVILGNVTQNAPFEITIGPIKSGTNDRIENTISLGTLQDTFRIAPLVLNCAYSADNSDVIAGIIPASNFASEHMDTGTNATVSNSRFMTAWYDLSVPGLGNLELFSNYGIYVYEILDSMRWAQWKGKAQFRDSLASYLKPVAARAEFFNKSVLVYNGVCKPKHYAIALKRVSSYIPYISDLSGTWAPAVKSSQENDFCETAGEINMTSFVGKGISLDPRCLSKGEGFGEDGKNMSCLPLDIEYATAWVKVHVDPGDVYDVYFNVQTNFGGYANNEVHYRILFGSCSALNPGPCVVNANTQIGFQCMQPGDYFIQIAVPKDMGSAVFINNPITVSATVRQNGNSANCTSFDLTKPLANFEFEGQCKSDSVFFTNYSSQGSDISYLWDFGDGQTSTEKDPRVELKTLQVQEDREIKLFTTNTQNGKSDSFSRFIRLWKDPLSVDVPFGDTLIRCGTQLKISSAHSFSNGIPLYCFNGQDTLDGNTVNQRFTQNSEIRFLVWTAGCFVDTLVTVRISNKLGLEPTDTTLCKDELLAFDLRGWKSVSVTPHVQGPIYQLQETGNYVFTVSDSGCIYIDSIDVVSMAQVWPYGADSVVCDQDSILLSIDDQYQNYYWQDSSTATRFWANQSGHYWVEGQWGDCINRDSIWVSISDVSNPLLMEADTQCQDFEWTLRSSKTALLYIWGDGSQGIQTQTKDTGWMTLYISNAGCLEIDSVYLQHYPNELNLGNDTLYCDFIDMVLDAGQGSAYAWWPQYSGERFFQVPDTGLWGVWMIDQYGCEQEDTIHIGQSCGPYFQMPNAFSPNNDGINDWLQWVYVDIDEFEIYIYNRWGELMHHTTNIHDFWDGNFHGVTAGDGAYIYIVKYAGTSSNGIREEGKDSGSFILLRSDR